MKIDLVKQLMNEFENSKVSKMKVELEGIKLELEKNIDKQVTENIPIIKENIFEKNELIKTATNQEPSGLAIKSPIVGVYYAASAPTAKPYVEVGSKVSAGQVVCIVEAMKVMNEIKAPIDGIVSAIMVKSEDLVEYDQVLMMIEGN